MDKLSTEAVERRMADFSEWALNGDSLQRTFGFDDFAGAMSFVNSVAELAERLQHHPAIMIRYNKVTLTLTTHDVGGLSERDFTFAREVDDLLVEEGEQVSR